MMRRNHRLVIAVCAFLLTGCASRAMVATRTPRAGALVGGKVALVFSAKYDISFGGIEKLYHFDIHKYANIYKRLVYDGLVTPEDMFVPEEVS